MYVEGSPFPNVFENQLRKQPCSFPHWFSPDAYPHLPPSFRMVPASPFPTGMPHFSPNSKFMKASGFRLFSCALAARILLPLRVGSHYAVLRTAVRSCRPTAAHYENGPTPPFWRFPRLSPSVCFALRLSPHVLSVQG